MWSLYPFTVFYILNFSYLLCYYEEGDIMDYIIRKATVEDYIDIADISSRDLGYYCDPMLVKHKLERTDDSRECVMVAVCDSEVVGFVHMERYDVLYADTMVNILGLAVRQEYRHRGIGTALMNTVEDYALKKKIFLVRLNTGEGRVETHRFYKSLGYTDKKTQLRLIKKLKEKQ